MPPVLFRSTWGEIVGRARERLSLCCFKLLLQTVEPAVWTFGVWAANATQGNTTQLVFFGPKRLSSPIGGMPYDSMPESRDAREEDTKRGRRQKVAHEGYQSKEKIIVVRARRFWRVMDDKGRSRVPFLAGRISSFGGRDDGGQVVMLPRCQKVLQ